MPVTIQQTKDAERLLQLLDQQEGKQPQGGIEADLKAAQPAMAPVAQRAIGVFDLLSQIVAQNQKPLDKWNGQDLDHISGLIDVIITAIEQSGSTDSQLLIRLRQLIEVSELIDGRNATVSTQSGRIRQLIRTLESAQPVLGQPPVPDDYAMDIIDNIREVGIASTAQSDDLFVNAATPAARLKRFNQIRQSAGLMGLLVLPTEMQSPAFVTNLRKEHRHAARNN